MNIALLQSRTIFMKNGSQFLSVFLLLISEVFGSTLELSVFDCGQGNAVVARFNHQTMILDAGSKARKTFVGFACATDDRSEIDVEFSLGEEGDPMWLDVSDPVVPEITKKKEVDKLNKWHWERFSAEVFGGKVINFEDETAYTIPKRFLKSVFVSHPDVDHYSLLRRLIKETPSGGRRFKDVPFLLGGKKVTYETLTTEINKLKGKDRPKVICDHTESVGYFCRKVIPFSETGAAAASSASCVPEIKILTVNSVDQGKKKRRNRNLDSMVVRASMHGHSFLMPGDAEGETWKSIVASSGIDPLQSDVFLVAHHGAYTAESTSLDLLRDRIKPKICLISAGFMHKHPDVRVIKILKGYFEGTSYRTDPHFLTYYTSGKESCSVTNLPIFTTMDNGRIDVSFKGEGISLKVARNFLPDWPYVAFTDSGMGRILVANHPLSAHSTKISGYDALTGLPDIFTDHMGNFLYQFRPGVFFQVNYIAASEDETVEAASEIIVSLYKLYRTRS